MLKKIRIIIIRIIAVIFIYLMVPCAITLIMTGVTEPDFNEEIVGKQYVKVNVGNRVKSYELETFVIMAVASNYHISSEEELLKAESIAIRTNIRKIMKNEQSIDSEDLDISYLNEYQMKSQWGEDYEANYELIKRCVSQTEGVVMRFNGELIDARMQELSSGKTLSGKRYLGEEYEYLTKVDCTQDIQKSNYLQVKTFSKGEIIKKVKNKFKNVGITESELLSKIQIVSKAESGHIIKLQIGNVVMSGETFAKILELSSNCMEIEAYEDGIKITTKGVGYGYGMSLSYGDFMAKSDSTYKDILGKFYTGVSLCSE